MLKKKLILISLLISIVPTIYMTYLYADYVGVNLEMIQKHKEDLNFDENFLNKMENEYWKGVIITFLKIELIFFSASYTILLISSFIKSLIKKDRSSH